MRWSHEGEDVTRQIGSEVNLLSEAEEGGQFCHAFLMLGAVGTHTTGLQRVKWITVAISDTAPCRASVHSAVKGHLSRNMFRGQGVRAATPFFFFA